MENLNACPVCEKEGFEKFIDCKDYTVSQETFTIVRCKHCGFKFTNPRPTEREIGKYYESEDYVSHSNTSKGLINSIYQIARKFTLGRKLSLVNSIAKERSLLDYGCGTGEFLNYCKTNGWETNGLEPSPEARKFAIDNYGLQLHTEEEVFKMEEERFGVITMWHVLEHVHKLKNTLGELKRLLKKGGALVVAVPNPNSLDAKIYKEVWAAYDVPRHLYHFTDNDIIRLANEFDLHLEKVMPMKLDSYYVSLLSEKYKNGSGNLARAFISGLKSNMAATTSKKPSFSSQIYILRK